MSSIASSTLSKRTYKIVLLGNEGVGKTSMINRFCHNKFDQQANVHFFISSPLSGLTSLAKTSPTKESDIDCNCGILQASKDTDLSSPRT